MVNQCCDGGCISGFILSMRRDGEKPFKKVEEMFARRIRTAKYPIHTNARGLAARVDFTCRERNPRRSSRIEPVNRAGVTPVFQPARRDPETRRLESRRYRGRLMGNLQALRMAQRSREARA